MNFASEKFTGIIILQGRNQVEVSNILDQVYFNTSYIKKYNETLPKEHSSEVMPLVIKQYYKGVLLKYSFLYESAFIKEIEKKFFIKPSNYLEGIKFLKEKYLNTNDITDPTIRTGTKSEILSVFIDLGITFAVKIYNNLLYNDTLNIFSINIYNDPCVLYNSKLSKKQSENIIVTLTEFQKILDIPQNKWILNNIIKQYKYHD